MYYSMRFYSKNGSEHLYESLRSWLKRNSMMILEIVDMVMIDPNTLVLVYKTKPNGEPLM